MTLFLHDRELSRDQAGERSFEFGVKLTLLGVASLWAQTIAKRKAQFQRLAGVTPRGTTANITVLDEVGENSPITLKIGSMSIKRPKLLLKSHPLSHCVSRPK